MTHSPEFSRSNVANKQPPAPPPPLHTRPHADTSTVRYSDYDWTVRWAAPLINRRRSLRQRYIRFVCVCPLAHCSSRSQFLYSAPLCEKLRPSTGSNSIDALRASAEGHRDAFSCRAQLHSFVSMRLPLVPHLNLREIPTT